MNDRYSRHLLLPEIGENGQEKISQARIGIAGVGALGTVVAELLCRAGVKKLVLVDRDVVEENNLQRQALFTTKDLGLPKVHAAQEHLQQINPAVEIEIHAEDITPATITSLYKNTDLLIDGLDNVATRLLLNDFCKKKGIPWVSGAAIQDKGTVISFLPEGPCYTCIFPKAKEAEGHLDTCDTVGVLNAVTHLVGALQAAAALKILVGKAEPHLTRLQIWREKWATVQIDKHPDCPACRGEYRYMNAVIPDMVQMCGKESFQVRFKKDLDLAQIKGKASRAGNIQDYKTCLKIGDITLFPSRALVKAKTAAEAQKKVAQYLGV